MYTIVFCHVARDMSVVTLLTVRAGHVRRAVSDGGWPFEENLGRLHAVL